MDHAGMAWRDGQCRHGGSQTSQGSSVRVQGCEGHKTALSSCQGPWLHRRGQGKVLHLHRGCLSMRWCTQCRHAIAPGWRQQNCCRWRCSHCPGTAALQIFMSIHQHDCRLVCRGKDVNDSLIKVEYLQRPISMCMPEVRLQDLMKLSSNHWHLSA